MVMDAGGDDMQELAFRAWLRYMLTVFLLFISGISPQANAQGGATPKNLPLVAGTAAEPIEIAPAQDRATAQTFVPSGDPTVWYVVSVVAARDEMALTLNLSCKG